MLPANIEGYKTRQVLCKGLTAIIVKAVNVKTEEEVAIKIFDREKITEKGMIKYLESELRLIARLNHPAFPKIHDIIYDEKHIMIVMDYLPNGSVLDAISNRTMFSYSERLTIVYKILEGISYLHDRGIAHRDIKPDNIVFDIDNQPKIIDFGFSCEFAEMKNTFCGTETYMAPEVMKREKYNGFKADIWAFAITAHILLTSQLPYEFMSEARYINDMENGTLKLRVQCPGILGKIITNCLNIDPDLRPTAREILDQMKYLMENDIVIKTAQGARKMSLPKLPIDKKLIDKSKTGRNIHTNIVGKLCPHYRLRRFDSF